jgi:cyclic pyranopterin phosphate synthase
MQRPLQLSPEAAVEEFNKRLGRLRVSVTHACQLGCRFCHQEGIEPHWKPVHIPLDYFQALLQAYSEIGGHYVELTGGEPLMHPKISDLLRVASAHARHLSLHTNGLELDKVTPELRAGCVQLVKLSLHAAANSDSARWLLGPAWDFERVAANISRTLETGTKVQLLYTLTEKNASVLADVLDLALEWGVDTQLVDLIPGRNKNTLPMLGYLGGDLLEAHVSVRADYETTVRDRTGATLKIYRTRRGATWELKDCHYGLFHSGMCDGCSLRAICGEGVYALRLDAKGIFKPCLLRGDLDVQRVTQPINRQGLLETIGQLLTAMMAPPTPMATGDKDG